MKKLLASLFAFVALCGPAFALSDSAIPTKVPTTWAQSAPGGNSTCPIPIPSQISITAGRASWTDGFPPVTFLPLGSGGVPPFGADFNGVLCQLSQWTRWYNAGAPVQYDATFQSAVGGYPNSSVIQSVTHPGHFWLSTVDNNLSNPDSGGANWIDLYLLAANTTWAGVAGGTANAQSISIVGYNQTLNGISLRFLPVAANTGSATLIVNGVGSPIQIQKKTATGLQPLAGGELQPNQVAEVVLDGTFFELTPVSTSRFNIVAITATGTYTPSNGMTSADVTCTGGGGAGGGSQTTNSTQYSAGGGGGPAVTVEGTFTTAQLGGPVSVAIGTGGSGIAGAAGGNGGATSFGAFLNAPGGFGGNTLLVSAPSIAGTNTGGLPGTGGSGPVIIPGAGGQPPLVINIGGSQTQAIGGFGGSTPLGGGGAAQSLGNTTASVAGNNGTGYGSGGGGAVSGSNVSGGRVGGNGASGACIIKELIAQ